MSQIIPSSQIAALLEEKASLAPGEGMEVVRAVFSLIEEQLAAGHNVNIKKLGRFVLTDNEEKPIRFVPDTEYKAVVNAPFEAFEPFHLFADEVQVVEEPLESEDPEEPDTPTITTDEPEEMPEPESAVAEEEEASVDAIVTEDIPEDITEPEPEPQLEPESEPDTPQPPEVVILPPPLITEEPPQPPAETPPPLTPAPSVQEQPEVPDSYREQPVAAKRQICGWQCFWLAIAFIAGLFIGFALGYFNASTIIESFTINDCSAPPTAVDTVPRVDTDTVAHMPADTAHTTQAQAQAPDTAKKAVSAPAPRAPRYDTITRTTFLTTLARRYYGQMEYWVYIYDANKLGNPNSIAPGTTLVIPYPDQLPLTGNTEADIKAAKKRSAEIYARYQ